MTTSTPENNSPNPLISVVIPTFNRANTIINTLASVQNQNYIHFECLVIDDYSEDHTKQVIEQFSAADARFKYLKNQNRKGAGGARNTGLIAAKGKYITFLDSDDLLLAHALTNRLSAFTKEPQLDLVIANQARLNNGKLDYLVNVPTKKDPLVRFYSLYPRTDIPWVNNTLISRDFLLANNIRWQENLERYQDVQFNLSIILNEPKYKWLRNQPDSYWVYNDEGISIGKNRAHYDQKLINITKVYLDSLQTIEEQSQIHYPLIRTHIKAFCAYSLFDFEDKNHAQVYYSFVKQQQLFHKFDDWLLRSYHQQSTWWIKKAIRLNFKLKLRKALKDDLFLKVPYVPIENSLSNLNPTFNK